MPRRYQLISYTVDAMQLTPDRALDAEQWSGGVPVTEYDAVDRTKKFVALNIPTLEGVKRAQEGDYIVKWPGGRIEVIPARQFENQFEPAKPA